LFQPTNRIAAQISAVLQGKYKPIFHKSQDVGDHVVVINTKQIDFSGGKWDKKLYRHHTTFPGGLREVKAKTLHEKKPTAVLSKAVKGMLPRNKLRWNWMDRLYLFEDDAHPYAANIFGELQGSTSTEGEVTLAPFVLRPGGELHFLEDAVEGEDVVEETLMHIPATTK
jgi:large subunit ribosomal protein L13